MRLLFQKLRPLLGLACLAFTAFLSAAQNQGVVPTLRQGDEVLLQMQQAFDKKDTKTLTRLLPSVRGHALEPWAAYWELRARLGQAQPQEIEAFLRRWQGTYQEDRLRNDWLLLLGQRRQWERFAQELPHFRMRDDREVHCYAAVVRNNHGKLENNAASEVLSHWYALRHADDGCSHAASVMLAARAIQPVDVWRKARLAAEAKRPDVARKAVALVAPAALQQLKQALEQPAKYLTAQKKATASDKNRHPPELITLALVRLVMTDRPAAVRHMGQWSEQFTPEERNWLWGLLGRQAALSLSPDALSWFAKVQRAADLTDDMLAWKARAALRAGQWPLVRNTIDAMPATLQKDSTWVYWKARALLAQQPAPQARTQALAMLQSIASTTDFYGQLALEELGQPIAAAPAPPPLTTAEKAAARANEGLNRGLYAVVMGLRREGVREWNYTTNMHTPGGMQERQLLAAADFACNMQVWDRCINTSERTKTVIHMGQRFPMPFKEDVVARTRSLGLDAAYVYGLIRQESRFIMEVRSSAGAKGLMQVMPATAAWTAKKIDLKDFKPADIYHHQTNITIGTAYLKLALDSFDGSLPLAAAAYNAGPKRPARWRKGRTLEAAIWAENIPFNETRDYVKKVLANTVNYAMVLTGQPQSLKARLGRIGPLEVGKEQVNAGMP